MGKWYQNSVWVVAKGGMAQFNPKAHYNKTLKMLLASFLSVLSRQSSPHPEFFSDLILP